MSYGHAERNLATIRALEQVTTELMGALRDVDVGLWHRLMQLDEDDIRVSSESAFAPSGTTAAKG